LYAGEPGLGQAARALSTMACRAATNWSISASLNKASGPRGVMFVNGD
jgi:hypothetical protein